MTDGLPKTRAEARAAGVARYYTGIECKWGHIGPRYALNGHCVACMAEARRRWSTTDSGRSWLRSYDRRSRGLPDPTRPAPSQCEGCLTDRHSMALCVDHDHTTGAFRGWLCRQCNLAVGNARDSPRTLLKLADYLLANRSATTVETDTPATTEACRKDIDDIDPTDTE